MDAARSFFPAAPVLAAKVHGWVYLSAGEMDHPLLNARRGGGDVTYEGNRSTPRGTRAIYLEKSALDTLNQVPTALSLSQHLAAKWLRHKETVTWRGSKLHGRPGLFNSSLLPESRDLKKKVQAAHKPKAELVCLCLLFVILRSKHQNCLCWFSNSSSAEAHAVRTFWSSSKPLAHTSNAQLWTI